jgi:hypothetical protein
MTGADWIALRRYRSKLVDLIDAARQGVQNAPKDMDVPRKSIEGLLMASFYLLDVNDGLREMDDAYYIRSAIRELEDALGPLGLGVDYWDKINAGRLRDTRERGETVF